MYIYDLYANNKIKLDCETHFTGKELKDFIKMSQDWDSKLKLRLLCSGAEIKDDVKLYQYKLQNDYLIQMMKSTA